MAPREPYGPDPPKEGSPDLGTPPHKGGDFSRALSLRAKALMSALEASRQVSTSALGLLPSHGLLPAIHFSRRLPTPAGRYRTRAPPLGSHALVGPKKASSAIPSQTRLLDRPARVRLAKELPVLPRANQTALSRFGTSPPRQSCPEAIRRR